MILQLVEEVLPDQSHRCTSATGEVGVSNELFQETHKDSSYFYTVKNLNEARSTATRHEMDPFCRLTASGTSAEVPEALN